jgi:hypothetical protein
MKTIILLLLVLITGCNAQVTSDPPVPDCLRDPGTVSIGAPERFDLSEQCTETPDPAPGLNEGRRSWCCWQYNAPDITKLGVSK